MKVLKCKMCGGDIITNENQTYGTCDSCGTISTLPKVDNEQIANLFNRANHFRRQNDFDKALSAYENILEIQSDNAEAYWGVVLSRFGIEYVDDVQTQTKIPTCHRVQTQSILSDSDYLQALNYSEDSYTRSLYEKEAQKIYEIQRGILEISKNEDPYDVFICYKESKESGSRTIDSTIAQEIYYKLKNEGYNVFFSRITLEDKLGKEYEPYIFAALNSAKVMLVVGTKPEYFRSTWVKNEWMRYLSLMKKDKNKVLIPCYRDMNAYDIPDEMSMLQSQDMSKIGFIQDLIRGIQKVLVAKTSQIDEVNTQSRLTNTNESMIDSILKRVKIFLEDEEWDRALEYCEKALDIEPSNVQAYVYRACITFKCQREEDLSKESVDRLKNNIDYKKALRFSDSILRNRLNGYIDEAQKREEEEERKRKEEEERKRKEEEERKRKEEEERKRKEEEERKRKEEEERKIKKVIQITKKIVKFTVIAMVAGVAINTLVLKPNKYKYALSYIEENDFPKAIKVLGQLGDYKDSIKLKRDILDNVLLKQGNISGGLCSIVGLKSDGTVVAVGNSEVEGWNDIVEVSAGEDYVVGLKSDGTVVTTLDDTYGDKSEVEGWRDIVAIAAGENHVVGLKSDGTVVTTADDTYGGKSEVEGWRDIVAISAGGYHTVGLKSDGTVVEAGVYLSGDGDGDTVKGWRDIIAISAGGSHTVALKSDGTVVTTEDGNDVDYDDDYLQRDVEGWRDIVAISAGKYHLVGLKLDGTIVAVGNNSFGECNVDGWSDIVAISAGDGNTVGLKSDGTAVAVGTVRDESHTPTKVKTWSNLKVN